MLLALRNILIPEETPMILWAALLTLAGSLAGIFAFGSGPLLGANGVLELVAAISLFTAICAAEAQGG
jgi:hypothetical protein